jgi:hypothetical protein
MKQKWNKVKSWLLETLKVIKQKWNKVKSWLLENLKVMKYINGHRSKTTRWEIALLSFFGSIVIINFLGLMTQLHLTEIDPQVVLFSQAVMLSLFIYRQVIFYREICTLVEPLDIDFVHLGIKYTTYIHIAKVGIGFKVTSAAATIGTIGYVAHSLQNKDELILSLQNQLKDQNRDNKKVSDELIQSLQNQLKDQNRDNKNMAAEIESLKKKPKGFF